MPRDIEHHPTARGTEPHEPHNWGSMPLAVAGADEDLYLLLTPLRARTLWCWIITKILRKISVSTGISNLKTPEEMPVYSNATLEISWWFISQCCTENGRDLTHTEKNLTNTRLLQPSSDMWFWTFPHRAVSSTNTDQRTWTSPFNLQVAQILIRSCTMQECMRICAARWPHSYSFWFSEWGSYTVGRV